MNVVNVHERWLPCSANYIWGLVESLATIEDRLWPNENWPPMLLDSQLAVGAKGGHGPIRYVVSFYDPGKKVVFDFTGPAGFHGCHYFTVFSQNDNTSMIRHTIDMKITGLALVTWPLVYRPLHDALIEDAFDKAEGGLDEVLLRSEWSKWVRFLRVLVGRRN